MKGASKKYVVMTLCVMVIFGIISGCGNKEAEKAEVNTLKDYYQFREISDIDSDIYYVTLDGIEMTKRQYDNIYNFEGHYSMAALPKSTFESLKDDDGLVLPFGYEYDKEDVGTFNRYRSISKKKEETYRNTSEGTKELSRDEAAEHALNEIDYEPICIRKAHDSKTDMWRMSLYSKDNGEETIYTNVYMTAKGKTVLITQVYDVPYTSY